MYAEDGTKSVSEPEMSMFPMQIQPYLRVGLSEEWSVYGSYALGPNTHRGEACDTVFKGQSCFDAALQYEGQTGLTVRGGMIQPSIGMRWDDHTILTRGDAAQRRVPMIPPNYAEWGMETAYQPISSFRTELGVMHTQNLSDAVSGNQGDPSFYQSLISLDSVICLIFNSGVAAIVKTIGTTKMMTTRKMSPKRSSPPTNGHVWLTTRSTAATIQFVDWDDWRWIKQWLVCLLRGQSLDSR